jgi:hypothetical protein
MHARDASIITLVWIIMMICYAEISACRISLPRPKHVDISSYCHQFIEEEIKQLKKLINFGFVMIIFILLNKALCWSVLQTPCQSEYE